jgi:NAD(P)-dependent dehydrogenase (short-subunit alcohol dehydrogenase family)
MGEATARRMAAEGASVAVFDQDGEAAARVARDVGGHAYEVDVADWDQVAHAVAEAERAMGGVSILHNNAGISTNEGLETMDPAAFRRIIEVDLLGVFHGIKAVAPIMLASGDGRIVNTASISGVRPSDGEGAYGAAKAGVIALTATAALEYGPAIRVNAVSPGTIRTPMTHDFLTRIPGMYEHQIQKIPLARVGDPNEVADVVVLLCSDLMRYVTGQNLVVDGGMLLHGAGSDGLLFRIRELLGKARHA